MQNLRPKTDQPVQQVGHSFGGRGVELSSNGHPLWSKVELEHLHTWIAGGLTASMISSKLTAMGFPRTRNAVIGRANRHTTLARDRQRTKKRVEKKKLATARRIKNILAGLDASCTRNQLIVMKRRAGLTLAVISSQHGITRERVRQIVFANG